MNGYSDSLRLVISKGHGYWLGWMIGFIILVIIVIMIVRIISDNYKLKQEGKKPSLHVLKNKKQK